MSDNRDTRSSSALFKRAEQLKRWEESDTNKQSPIPKQASRIQFSLGIVFLAACTAGDKDEVQKLLNLGADINTANVDGLTALHQACIDDNLDMVEFLVSRGADVNRGDNEGWTPLHATTSCGFLSIARYLLENGADVGAVNCDGELAVDIAESDNMEQLLQKAIDEKGIDCDSSRNAEVNTLLNDAKHWTKNGYVEVRDQKTGGTPLHVAAAKGYVDVARILLEECNADPDCVDYEGWTPLHAAALWGHKEAASILLKNGADPDIKNYSGQTCMDLVDPAISTWLAEAALKAPKRIKNNNNNNNNNTIRVHSAPPDVKTIVPETINDKPVLTETTNKQPEGKPPKGRAPSPETTPGDNSTGDEPPSWRRSASMRTRQHIESNRDNNKVPVTNNHTDNDTILRRTHSFENDKTFYQRYRDVTARIKASSCPSIPPPAPLSSASTTVELRKRIHDATNNTTDTNHDEAHNRTSPTAEKRDDNNTWSSQINQNINNSQTIRRSFVPPVKDEESETQRKAHAKRVRETRRSTQGVTLDEIKSAEQLVKKKNTNGSPEKEALPSAPLSSTNKKIDEITSVTSPDKNQTFELEEAGRSPPRSPASAVAVTTSSAVPSTSADATVTIPLRRPFTNSKSSPSLITVSDEKAVCDDEKEQESSAESKSSSSSPASTQAALNMIQRRRRPKRRSTGVGHVDMDDITNDRSTGDTEPENDLKQSGSERTVDDSSADLDYKVLYEEASSEVQRLRSLLATSEQQLRDARSTITRLTQVNQNSISEIEKREKRAMERKLSEMEEELKIQHALQTENMRLRDENGALIRVISKLSK